MYYKNILDTIGNAPLVQLNYVCLSLPATVLAKLESFNPGHSIKDKIAVKMVESAEADGSLKPGGTIIEGTSGNTGMGLAIVAIVKGYKCLFTTNDKQSKEKIDMLRAMGAEVEVCPTNVTADDPRSYYSRAKALHEQTPNSIYINQYFNKANQDAHYETTGPEIWEQTEGKISHLFAGVGTGGTISGTGRFLKEKNPDIKIIGIDSYGSILKTFHETGTYDKSEIKPYITEGIGEDIIPDCVDFEVIDKFVKVTDKDGAIMARELANKESIFAGYSSGSAVAGVIQCADDLKKGDLAVVILPDHGSRYVGKIFNDDWMRDRGFLEKKSASDLASEHASKVIMIEAGESIDTAIEKMLQYDISQIPVTENEKIVGSIDDRTVFNKISRDPNVKADPVKSIMGDPYPIVAPGASLEEVSGLINKKTGAILIQNGKGFQIITRHDIIGALGK